MRAGDEVLWDVDEHARCSSSRTERRRARAGSPLPPVETYSNGARHVKVPEPDGNAIAFAEPPGAN
jgi:hypothetical protein